MIADYRYRLSREECESLVNKYYYVAKNHGVPQAYVAEHFPDWEFLGLFALLEKAKVANQSLVVDKRVRAFHFTDMDNFLVEWEETGNSKQD